MKKNIEKMLYILLPTKNHPEIILEWLKVYIENTNSFRAKVLILDSSDNEETKKICENYKDFVIWERFEKYPPNKSLQEMDDKVLFGFDRIEADYIWLTSDARIPNLDSCINILEEYMNLEKDIIHFCSLKSNMNKMYIEKHPERMGCKALLSDSKVYYSNTSLKEFFLDYFWSISTYGITIVKRKIVKNCKRDMFLKYSGLSFLYPAMIYEALYNSKMIDCVVLNCGCFIANEKRRVNTWKESGDAVKVYSEHVVRIIQALPSYFDDYKDVVMREFALNNLHMTLKDSLIWRKDNYYNFKQYKKYKEYIKIVAEKDLFVMFLISIIPRSICDLLIDRFK